MKREHPTPQTRSAPFPVAGEGGEEGGGVSSVVAISAPSPLAPPHKGQESSSLLIEQVRHYRAARARWGVLEYVFWLAALASIFLLPSRHLILTEIAWLALFALSLDLILGYAGIISLGHAAFFGLGSYAA